MKKKLILAAIVVAILFAFGFRAGHPQAGLTSAMGSAKSGVVLYKASSDYKVGQKVVIIVDGIGLQTGLVSFVTDKGITVDAPGSRNTVQPEEVQGKLLVVVPFIGTIFGLIGL